jgi:hypothetical protein
MAWKKAGSPWSARQHRHLSTIAEYLIDVKHRDGKSNVVADALSRAPIEAVSVGISHNGIKKGQQASDYVRDARTSITGLKLEDVQLEPDGITLLCDTSLGFPRPLLPPSLRKEAFDILHGLSHPGIRGTQKLLQDRYVWHRMKMDVKRWCQECQPCHALKYIVIPKLQCGR